ncbi:MAG: HlyC/CorC family transporter [Oscillospiraceae bacterium]|nr:HlyC/CorC family transporter [Oscillospiraceae bacterium]
MEYILIVLCLIGSAFFSGTEIAYTSLNKLKLRQESEHPSRIQRMVSYIYNHYDRALSTLLIGNNLVNIAATSIATVLAVRLADKLAGRITDDQASTIVTVVMTVIILIVGEITPKMIARRCSEGFAKMAAWPLLILMIVLFPAVLVTSGIVNLFSLLWRKKDERVVTITEEELESILDTAEDEGVIDENETDLLQSALEFTDMDAGDILTPRIDVVGFEMGQSVDEILQTINETQFSRYPVYEKTVDHVVGILYVKHLLHELMENKDVQLSDLLLEPVFIPKSMKLHDIMNEFRKSRTHMAVVADEYGGITGIVTMEDVLEQLVGEIWDENDDIVNDWQELDKNRYECSGDLNLSEFFDHLDMDDEDVETGCATVGGWATENIGAMPVPFDAFDYQEFTVLVREVDDNHRITRLIILRHEFEPEKRKEWLKLSSN